MLAPIVPSNIKSSSWPHKYEFDLLEKSETYKGGMLETPENSVLHEKKILPDDADELEDEPTIFEELLSAPHIR